MIHNPCDFLPRELPSLVWLHYWKIRSSKVEFYVAPAYQSDIYRNHFGRSLFIYILRLLPLLLVIRSVPDVLRVQSKFVKSVGGEAAGRTPYTFYKPTLGPKYVSNRHYNEFITTTTFM